MHGLPHARFSTGVALALATAALTAPSASAYPLDPEGGRLVVPTTTRATPTGAKPKKAKPAKPATPRRRPPLEP